MKRKYLINGNSIKRNKRKAIREAFLPLMGRMSQATSFFAPKAERRSKSALSLRNATKK